METRGINGSWRKSKHAVNCTITKGGTFSSKDVQASKTALFPPIVWNFNTDTLVWELRPKTSQLGQQCPHKNHEAFIELCLKIQRSCIFQREPSHHHQPARPCFSHLPLTEERDGCSGRNELLPLAQSSLVRFHAGADSLCFRTVGRS